MTIISNNEIARAIYGELKDKHTSAQKESLKKVVSFLDRKHLMSKTSGILSLLEKVIAEEAGMLTVRVRSARNLGEKMRTHLRTSLKKRYSVKNVILKEEVDERLLGGMRLEVNDEVIDLSMRNKITQLQEYLTR